MFEEKWVVELKDNRLSVTTPAHENAQILFDQIKGVAIETNDTGPFGSDVIWHISDGKVTIQFPMGATGERQAIYALQQLDGFDNQAVIDAMACTENRVFIALNKLEPNHDG